MSLVKNYDWFKSMMKIEGETRNLKKMNFSSSKLQIPPFEIFICFEGVMKAKKLKNYLCTI